MAVSSTELGGGGESGEGSLNPFAQSSKPPLVAVQGIGLEVDDGVIVEFGDYNSDLRTDVIVLTQHPDRGVSEVSVHLWTLASNRFEKFTSVEVPRRAVGVVAADLNFDGRLDMLVTCLEGDPGSVIVFIE